MPQSDVTHMKCIALRAKCLEGGVFFVVSFFVTLREILVVVDLVQKLLDPALVRVVVGTVIIACLLVPV